MNNAEPSSGNNLEAGEDLDLVRRMNEAAGALTEALGLPAEEKYHTLSLLYEDKHALSDGASQAEANKTIARRVFEEAVNQGNLEVVDELFANDVMDRDPASSQRAPGSEGIKQSIERYRAAFPDLYVEVEDIIGEDDKVVTHERWHGTQEEPYEGIEPNGERRLDMTRVHIFYIVGDKILETWAAGSVRHELCDEVYSQIVNI